MTSLATVANDESIQVLTFEVQGETFALEASLVREILDPPAETQVPGAAAFVNAVMNFRGKVIPIADLRLAFGFDRTAATPDSRIVVIELELEGDATLIGLRADRVHEVATLLLSATDPPPSIGLRWRQDYIRRVGRSGDEPIIIPDLACIFANRGMPVASLPPLHTTA